MGMPTPPIGPSISLRSISPVYNRVAAFWQDHRVIFMVKFEFYFTRKYTTMDRSKFRIQFWRAHKGHKEWYNFLLLNAKG